MFEFMRGKETLLGAVLVTALALLPYAGTLGNDFVWADQTVIVDGEAILKSPGDLARVFVKPLWSFTGAPAPGGGGYYRPVTAISYTIDHALWGLNPAGYHATNILLHGAVTLFLFLFFAGLFPKSRVPLLAGILFAVHPIHTEAVAWISGRTGLLAALGVVLSLFLYRRPGNRPLFLAGSLAAFALGLGAKESAAVLPLLVLLTAWWSRKPGRRLFAWNREGLYFALLVLYLVVRRGALGAFGTGNPETIEPLVLVPTMLRALGGYLRLLFIPWPLHTNDGIRLSTFVLEPKVLLSLLFLGAFVYAVLRYGRDRRETRFGLLWMGVALLPFLNVLPLLHFRAERLIYLPSAGFVLVAAALLDRWGDRILGKGKRLGLTPGELATATLALLLAFGTAARCRTWKNDYTLFMDTLAKNTYAPEACYMLGAEAYRNGAYPEAARLFRASLSLEPGWAAYLPVPWALANLGFAEYKGGDPESAEEAFREALRFYPGMEKASFGLALAASASGRHEESIESYQAILAKNPNHEDARYNLALEYEKSGALADAEREYIRVVRQNPRRKDAFMNLGSLVAQSGRYAEAMEAYRGALRVAPADPRVHYNVGLLFAVTGERKGAIEALRTALEFDPGYEEARLLLEEITAPDSLPGG
ncbi:MAG: tetratricopeptide repeat protein [Candidatus Eisenbacteria bacterium]